MRCVDIFRGSHKELREGASTGGPGSLIDSALCSGRLACSRRAAGSMPLVDVVVPPGASPGQTLQVQLGDQIVNFVVPSASVPGSRMRIDVPDARPLSAPPALPVAPPAVQGGNDGGAAGLEKIGVIVATLVGLVGVIAALGMLHNLDVGGEGILAAAICLAAAGVLSVRLRKDFRNQDAQRSLTPSEDTTMGAVIGLIHVAVVALTLQFYFSVTSSDSTVGVDSRTDEAPFDSVSYVNGSRPLFGAQLLVHLAVVAGQAKFLLGFGERFPAFAERHPRGGFVAWLVCSSVPIVVLFVGFATWSSLTCDSVHHRSGHNDTTNTGQSVQSSECYDDAAVFSWLAGGVLLLTSVSLTQASNRGWLAVWSLPVLAVIVVVWSAARTSETLSPLLLLPVLAVWVSLLACFSGGGSSAKWSEATTSVFAASLLVCQITGVLPDHEMHLNLVDSAQESFFTSTGSVLWLTQFVFLPAVLLNRAAFPAVTLVAGSGLLSPADAFFSIPLATLVGLAVIKLTPSSANDRQISILNVQGFNLGYALDEQQADAQRQQQPDDINDPNNNNNRLLACGYLTPALSFSYLVASWACAAGNGNLWLSALLVVCPVGLGVAQMLLHKLSPRLAGLSLSMAIFLTAGAWLDPHITLIFSLLLVPLLIGGRIKIGKLRTQNAPGLESLTRLHWCCSLVLLLFITFHKLSLHPVQPWAYTVGLYIFCFEPLGTQREGAEMASLRLLRPGTIGPLLCVVPSTFWTIAEQGYICLNDVLDLSRSSCNESSAYYWFMVLPIAIVLTEWVCDEIRSTRQGNGTRTKQQSRTAALVWFAVCALPFRVYLFMSLASRDDGSSVQCRRLCLDNVRKTHSAAGNWTECDWCEYVPLDDTTMKQSGVIFSALLLCGPALLGTIALAAYSNLATRTASPVGVELTDSLPSAISTGPSLVDQNVQGNGPQEASQIAAVPPTQAMAMALLLTALLDYYTPLIAAPVCLVACYMSYVGFSLTRQQGTWPSGLLAAVGVWVVKSGIGYFGSTTRGLWGVHIFGIVPSIELVDFMQNFDSWWPPMMGALLLGWGAFVRLKLVTAWPQDSEGSDFSWERLMYICDAVVFYIAVLLMADLSGGWICIILCSGAAGWGLFMRDITVVMRLPALFLTSFLLLEHFQGWDTGSMAFFASSVACIVAAVLTSLIFHAGPDDQQTGVRNVWGMVDITFLWAFVIAFLDGRGGVTHGGLAFSLSLALVPFLHFRGYPLLLASVPLVVPTTFLWFLDNLDVESHGSNPNLIGSLMGLAAAAALVLLSVIKISPPIAGDASEFTSMGVTLDKRQYHAFLHWAGTCWMYIWVVFGFYYTEISIPAALVGTLVVGISNLTLGIQNESLLLRMSGLIELCGAIFLGATAPGVNGFVQAVLVLVGSMFALGSAGMYFYWRKTEQADEIRPVALAVEAPARATTGSSTLEHAVAPLGASRPVSPEHAQVPNELAVEELRQFDENLAASALGYGGGNDLLLDAVLQASRMVDQFTDEQKAAISVRLADAARTVLREVARPPETMVVVTERLNVRAAPDANAHVLRKLPRHATVSVSAAHHTVDSEWRQLASSAEPFASASTNAAAGWVCSAQQGTRFLILQPHPMTTRTNPMSLA